MASDSIQIVGRGLLMAALAYGVNAPLAAWADDAGYLSGQEIEQTFAGSTVVAQVLGGDEYTEYFAPDGAVTLTGDDGVYDGTWWIVEDTICIELTFPSNDGCWQITLEGDDITMFGEDGAVDYEKTIIERDGTGG